MYGKIGPGEKKNPIFVCVSSSKRKECGASYSRTYIVSLDREHYYKVHAFNSRQALNIVMDIGKNPPTTTQPHLHLGKKRHPIQNHSIRLRLSVKILQHNY